MLVMIEGMFLGKLEPQLKPSSHASRKSPLPKIRPPFGDIPSIKEP
jgi:hypothetical protein